MSAAAWSECQMRETSFLIFKYRKEEKEEVQTQDLIMSFRMDFLCSVIHPFLFSCFTGHRAVLPQSKGTKQQG